MELTMPVIIGAALADSINPCAFGVLIFLLAFLSIIKASKKKILKIGLTYIVVVFLCYFAEGIFLMKLITSLGIEPAHVKQVVYPLAALVLLIIGLVEIRDAARQSEEATLAIPKRVKPYIEKYIHKATIPAAIVLGILVSLSELPCTGGVYLGILALLAGEKTCREAIPCLLLYNFIFVLPLFVILGLIYAGLSSKKLEELREKNKEVMRLLTGITLILLSLLLFWLSSFWK